VKQTKITSFSNCFEQQSVTRPFASESSSADFSLNISYQEVECSGKMIPTTADCAIWWTCGWSYWLIISSCFFVSHGVGLLNTCTRRIRAGVVQKWSFAVQKTVLSQGNYAMLQLFFSVYSSPTTFTTSLRVAKLQKPCFRRKKKNLTQNCHSGHSRPRVSESVESWSGTKWY